jgi:hypothetical protein
LIDWLIELIELIELIAWLLDCLITDLWFIDSLFHWIIDSLIQSLVHYSLTHWFTRALINWFTESPVHWVIDSLNHRFMGSFVHCFIHSLVHWLVDSLSHCFVFHWFTGSLIHWFIDSSVHSFSCAQILSCHFIGVSTRWWISQFNRPDGFCISTCSIGHWFSYIQSLHVTSFFRNFCPGECRALFGRDIYTYHRYTMGCVNQLIASEAHSWMIWYSLTNRVFL